VWVPHTQQHDVMNILWQRQPSALPAPCLLSSSQLSYVACVQPAAVAVLPVSLLLLLLQPHLCHV
jgi:hypothetical protein